MTSSCVPFWLGPRLTATVQGLQNDPSSVSTLSEGVRATLNTAGILVSHRSTDLRRQARATNSQQCRTKFQESGYAPINGLIHPFHVAALRRCYRRQIRKGAIRLGDQQSPHRYVAHNEPVARFYHVQLTKTGSDLF
jgi:hypothetical protein